MFMQDVRRKRAPSAPKSNQSVAKQKTEGTLYPLHHATAIYTLPRYKTLLDKIVGVESLAKLHYEQYYYPLAAHLAEFVQFLPWIRQRNNLVNETILARSLYLGFLALSYPRQDLTELWRFALASALMLRDLGTVVYDFEITIYDEKRKPKDRWNPLDGAMLTQGQFYSYQLIGDANPVSRVHNQVVPLIARTILPENAFAWIAGDANVFAAWMAWLTQEEDDSRHILPEVWPWVDQEYLAFLDKQTIFDDMLIIPKEGEESKQQEEQAEQEKQNDIAKSKVSKFWGDPTEHGALLAGQAFLEWLQTNLQSGKISVNQAKSNVHVLPNGKVLLVTPGIFNAFYKGNPQYAGKGGQIERYLVEQNLLQKGENNQYVHTIQSKNPQQTGSVQGLVITNVEQLFKSLSTGVNYDMRITSNLYTLYASKGAAPLLTAVKPAAKQSAAPEAPKITTTMKT